MHDKEVQGIPLVHKLVLNGEDQGLILCDSEKWRATKLTDKKLIEEIGNFIHEWYE
jgi:hypothetical protein